MRTFDGDDDSYDHIDKKFGDDMIKIWRNDDGKIHRDRYPAVIDSRNRVLFCYHGKICTTDKHKGNECFTHQ